MKSKPTKICPGRWLTGALVLGVSLLSSAQTDRIELPDLGASADTLLSPTQARQIARQIVHQMRAQDMLLEDPQIDAYFRDMGYRLVSHSGEPTREHQFLVIRDPTLNAFAAPGGVVGLHTGMILTLETEAEVAGVVAHEIAHVTQQHLVRRAERTSQMQIPLTLAMLGLILASGGNPEVIQGAVLGGQGIAAQAQINFTRQNEYEADRLGIKTLVNAGYDPSGMAGAFQIMNRVGRNYNTNIPEYLRSHPVTTTRIAEAKNRAQQLEQSVDASPSLKFQLMRERVRALQDDEPERAIRYFDSQLELGAGPFPQAYRYGLSVVLRRSGQLARARELAAGLVAEDPERLAYQIELAEIEIAAGDVERGLGRFERLHRERPGNRVLAHHYARALLGQDQPALARRAQTLIRNELMDQDTIGPQIYELLARSAKQSGDEVTAGTALAEALYRRGKLHDAIRKLSRLTQREDLDYYQRAKITARLSELRMEFAQRVRRQG